MEEVDDRLRTEHLKYAKFVARREHLARQIHPAEFQSLTSAVTQRLIHYDPNFDFSPKQPAMRGPLRYFPPKPSAPQEPEGFYQFPSYFP